MANETLQAGLEIGSSHIKCVIGRVTGETVNALGYSSLLCKGVREGNVVNITQTVETVREVVEKAETQAKQNVNYLNFGLHGLHISSQNHRGAIGILSQDKEIGFQDIKQVLESARAFQRPVDRQIIHTIPQEYIVDQQEGVVDPIGMVANHLRVNVHIVTALSSALTNLKKCVEKASFEINNVILASLAASEVVLSDEEKDIGCLLIDIGGKLCEVSYYCKGSIRGFETIKNGSDYITSDIAHFLKTSLDEAMRIKEDFGFATPAHIPKEGKFTITKIDGRTKEDVSIKEISKMLSARLNDIFEEIKKKMVAFNIEPELIASCVVTGGGASLPGIAEYLEEKIGIVTRIGLARNCIGDNAVVGDPSYTSVLGLLKYDTSKEVPTPRGRSGPRRKGLIELLKKIF